MKKSIIYTLCILLSGSLFLGSCDDMLDYNQNRVITNFDKLTAADSVYSVLGILKAVQGVADRQVLLGEMRADLISLNPGKAVLDIQELSNFTYGTDNKYVDASDYYRIINNCNLFLARVDTSIYRNNRSLFLPEMVAVKSVRAWTYLQLAINYGAVPYYTQPILSHSQATEVMRQPRLTIEEIAPLLIEDIEPLVGDPKYTTPYWDGIKSGAGTNIDTKKLFPPLRMLLGELNLWLKNYDKAAQYYYDMIYDAGYVDNGNAVTFSSKEGKGIINEYSDLFKSNAVNAANSLFVIPMEVSTSKGIVSELGNIFTPGNTFGGHQVVASPAINALRSRQVNLLREQAGSKYTNYYSVGGDWAGDLRLFATTMSQPDIATSTLHTNIITKHTLDNIIFNTSDKQVLGSALEYPTYIRFYRSELLYLRLAEALVGMTREGAEGAAELAMAILKDGPTKKYTVLYNIRYEEKEEENAAGETIIKTVKTGDKLEFNFSESKFKGNTGIHSRGSGNSKDNKYYAFSDTCIARYVGALVEVDKELVISPELTQLDSLNYITDLVVDELALEFAFEGNRFTDLVRIAKAADDKDILAKRVAGRDFNNKATYRDKDATAYEYDTRLYSLLQDERNWFLPLPDSNYVPLTDVEESSGEENAEGGSMADAGK